MTKLRGPRPYEIIVDTLRTGLPEVAGHHFTVR